MNTPLKFKQEKRPNFQSERSDYRAHYEELAAQVMSSLMRHGRLVASFVALALLLACIIIPLMPRKYSAEAIIYPNLVSRDQGRDQGKVVPLASIDGAAIVAGEARLIRSDAILRAVATRLRNDSNSNAANPRSWAAEGVDWFRSTYLPETRNHSPFDRTVATLRNKVVVMNDTRSYLISISFTASSAGEAAQVVNAIVTEYLRDKARQRKLDKIDLAEAELRQQLAVYGDKHPKTLQAMAELGAERASLEAAKNSEDGDRDGIGSDQNVQLAVPNQTPTSPNGLVIFGLSLLSALLAGISLAVWIDRSNAERKQNAGYQPHPH